MNWDFSCLQGCETAAEQAGDLILCDQYRWPDRPPTPCKAKGERDFDYAGNVYVTGGERDQHPAPSLMLRGFAVDIQRLP